MKELSEIWNDCCELYGVSNINPKAKRIRGVRRFPNGKYWTETQEVRGLKQLFSFIARHFYSVKEITQFLDLHRTMFYTMQNSKFLPSEIEFIKEYIKPSN